MSSIVPAQQQRWPRGPWNELHEAALDGSKKRTIALLSQRLINIDQGDPNGRTPLMLAAQEGVSSVARVLLNRGANPCIQMDRGFSALHISALHGHLAVTLDLVKAGADLSAKNSEGSTCLCSAGTQR